jgi:hypothetical protein
MFDPVRRIQRSTTLALALSPVGIILIAVARLLLVSDYKVSTATAIVTSDGYVNTLVGTLVPVAPLLIPYLALVLLISRRFIIGVLAFLTAALVSPAVYSGAEALHLARTDLHQAWQWASANYYIVVLAAIAAVLLLCSAFLGPSASFRTLGVLFAIAIIPVALQLYPLPLGPTYYAQLLKQPWLSEQRIVVRGRPPVLGYVLSDSNIALEVLLSSDRSVVFYPNGTVVRQQICQVSADISVHPLVPLMSLRNPAPPCQPPSPTPPPSLDGGAELQTP